MKSKQRGKKRSEISCAECGAQCCRYVTAEIDKPTCKRDYDHLRWCLLHGGVHVFVDHEGSWYLEFETDCENLLDDHKCRNYSGRPRVCRDHGEGDDECETRSEREPCRHRFSTTAELEKFLDKRKIDWRWAAEMP